MFIRIIRNVEQPNILFCRIAQFRRWQRFHMRWRYPATISWNWHINLNLLSLPFITKLHIKCPIEHESLLEYEFTYFSGNYLIIQVEGMTEKLSPYNSIWGVYNKWYTCICSPGFQYVIRKLDIRLGYPFTLLIPILTWRTSYQLPVAHPDSRPNSVIKRTVGYLLTHWWVHGVYVVQNGFPLTG